MLSRNPYCTSEATETHPLRLIFHSMTSRLTCNAPISPFRSYSQKSGTIKGKQLLQLAKLANRRRKSLQGFLSRSLQGKNAVSPTYSKMTWSVAAAPVQIPADYGSTAAATRATRRSACLAINSSYKPTSAAHAMIAVLQIRLTGINAAVKQATRRSASAATTDSTRLLSQALAKTMTAASCFQ